MFKKYLLTSLLFFIVIGFFGISSMEITNAVDIKESLLQNTNIDNSMGDKVNNDDGLSMLTNIFVWVKDSLTSLIVIVAVAAFLFIGARLALARGNPEEFKKGMMQLVYAIVGIFIVSVAWAAVYLVSGLQI